MDLPKLSINLVVHNGEKYLPFCLSSLRAQTFHDFELKVINNGSSDKSLDCIAEIFPQLKVISYDYNIGFAKAHNHLISWSKNPFIMILNQDVILEPGFLQIIISFFESNLEASACMGKILRWNSDKNRKTKIIDSLGLRIFKNHSAADVMQGQEDDDCEKENKEIFGVSGAAAVFKKEALEKTKVRIGARGMEKHEYFDEDFFSYKEDVDLAYRIKISGQKAFLIPSAVAYHQRSVSKEARWQIARKKRPCGINVYSYKNHLHAIVKNEFFKNIIRFFLPILFYETKKVVYFLFFERQTLKGVKMFYKELPKMLVKRKFIRKNIKKIKAKELAKWIYQ